MGDITLHYVNMNVSQPFGHWLHGDNHVNNMLDTWFHAMLLSTTFIPSRNFLYIQCSAVDIQTDSFTTQTVQASLPDVREYHLMLDFLFD